MPRVTYIQSDGAKQTIDVETNSTVMEGAILNDVGGIIGLCGGICSCATCHCYVAAPWAEKLRPPTEGELGMLERAVDRRAESRLGCQITITDELDGLVLHLPAHQSLDGS